MSQSVIGALRVNLGLDAAQFETGVRRASTATQNFQRQMVRFAAQIGGILGAAFSVRGISRAADSWTDLSSRVRLAIGENENAAQVMGQLSEMARRTYSSLGLTVEGWLANSRALRDMGMSTQESLRFQEAMNNALVVSGARAERAASVQEALSRAMAAGRLAGDQLNTIIQTGGRVAELLAAELGTTVSGLRAMGQQGLITGEVIRRALVGNLEMLREEADSMPATIGDAFTLIGNAFLQLVGGIDQATGASSAVAGVLVGVADNLQLLASFAVAAAGALAASYVPAITQAVFGTGLWIASLVTLRGALMATGVGALVVGAGLAINALIDLVSHTGSLGSAMTLLGEVAAGVWNGIVSSAGAIPLGLSAVWLNVKAGFGDLMADLTGMWADFLRTMVSSLGEVSTPFGSVNLGEMIGIDGSGAAALAASLRTGANMNRSNAAIFAGAASDRLSEGFEQAREAATRLSDAIRGVGEFAPPEIEEVSAAVNGLNETLEATGGSGGRARQALEDVSEAAHQAAAAAKQIESSFESAFVNFVSGTQSAREAVSNLLRDLARLAAQAAFRGLFGGLFGGGFGRVLGGIFGGAPSFAGGGFTGVGARMGGLDGRGGFPAILHPNETVIDHTKGQSGGPMAITVNVTGASGDDHVIALVHQGVRQGLAAYDRALPGRVRGLNPRRA